MCVWIEERKYALKINTHNTLSEPGSEYSVTAGTGEHVKHTGRQPAETRLWETIFERKMFHFFRKLITREKLEWGSPIDQN